MPIGTVMRNSISMLYYTYIETPQTLPALDNHPWYMVVCDSTNLSNEGGLIEEFDQSCRIDPKETYLIHKDVIDELYATIDYMPASVAMILNYILVPGAPDIRYCGILPDICRINRYGRLQMPMIGRDKEPNIAQMFTQVKLDPPAGIGNSAPTWLIVGLEYLSAYKFIRKHQHGPFILDSFSGLQDLNKNLLNTPAAYPETAVIRLWDDVTGKPFASSQTIQKLAMSRAEFTITDGFYKTLELPKGHLRTPIPCTGSSNFLSMINRTSIDTSYLISTIPLPNRMCEFPIIELNRDDTSKSPIWMNRL